MELTMLTYNKNNGLNLLLCIFVTVGLSSGGWAVDKEPNEVTKKSYQEYLDPNLPKDWSEISLTPYEGQRYEVEVPDTLDLAEIAGECVNYLTRLAPDEKDGWAYHILYLSYNPAILAPGGGQWKTPFFAECIPLMRAMSGSTQNLQRDRHLIGPLVFTTGKDGLCYMAVKGKPKEYVLDHITREAGQPYADMLNSGYQLNAYAMWYQHDQNPLWKQLALRKIDRLLELAVPKDNDDGSLYFRKTRGYSPWYKETGKGQLIALGDGDVVYKTMEGTPAGYTLAWTPEASAVWFDMTAHEPARKLAVGTARYLYEDREFYDANAKNFTILSKGGHPTVFTYCVSSMLSCGLELNHPEFIHCAPHGVEQFLNLRDPNHTGIVLSTEMCQIADMVQICLMLSRSGTADYWEIAERIMRNSISAMQVTSEEIKRFKSQPLCKAGDPNNTAIFKPVTQIEPIPLNKPLPPGFDQPDDASERCRGAWFVSLDNRTASIGCCNGRVPLAVYLTWDSIIESKDDMLKVNLLMNRASNWADIDSYLPYKGKVDIRMKTDQKELLVRIPKWVDRNQISCTLVRKDQWGATRVGRLPLNWSDKYKDYLSISDVTNGDQIMVKFPMKEYVEEARIPVSGNKIKTCQISYRGNTVIDISDKTTGYPLHTHEKYRSKHAAMHKVERFIYPHSFNHWGLDK